MTKLKDFYKKYKDKIKYRTYVVLGTGFAVGGYYMFKSNNKRNKDLEFMRECFEAGLAYEGGEENASN